MTGALQRETSLRRSVDQEQDRDPRRKYGDENSCCGAVLTPFTPPPEIDPNDQSATPRTTTRATPAIRFRKPSAWPTLLSVKPYFESAIEPELKAGKTVLIAAHGNSLRAIVKMLTTCLRKRRPSTSRPPSRCSTSWTRTSSRSKPRGEYPDPEAAAAGAAVAAQGQK